MLSGSIAAFLLVVQVGDENIVCSASDECKRINYNIIAKICQKMNLKCQDRLNKYLKLRELSLKNPERPLFDCGTGTLLRY
jgi:hypothetical protein